MERFLKQLMIFQTALILSATAVVAETLVPVKTAATTAETPLNLALSGHVEMPFDGSPVTLRCHADRLCLVKLRPGEQLADTPMVSLPEDWDMTHRGQGGEAIQVFVTLSPTESARPANLFIFTDQRVYDINLVPSQTDSVSVLSFTYPEE
ncbi:TrbG/VirB9 family P-type conjugative transfer protein [Ruegeria atlantica]|uniref:TrbG/VirB9 family P-type conjugative transfer protein n=1 Tax=Ruegeria atlantica TaxID=81569 RepID=UPI0014801706|nr:TrbG/VirB9 family P-type conjugative transfer protein [Ruegeria atlantica]